MFSWSKKSDSKKKTKRRTGSSGPALNEFGIPINQGGGANDEELEAELRALTGGVISLGEEDLELNDEGSDVEAEFLRMFGHSKGKKKSKGGKPKNEVGVDHVSVVKTGIDLNADDEDIGDEEDVDVDENDPELLGELMGLAEGDEEEEEEGDEEEEEEEEEKKEEKKEVTVTSLLMERLNMYKMAEAKAKENNESSRARRFARGIKTLQQLIKKAEAGKPVLPSEIPPEIATNLKPAPPPAPDPPAPAPSLADIGNDESSNPSNEVEIAQITHSDGDLPVEGMGNLTIDTNPGETEEVEDTSTTEPAPPGTTPEPQVEKITRAEEPFGENPLLSELRSRREEYKTAALTAKRNNDLENALKHVKCVKLLNALITAVEQGDAIDESEIPPSLSRPPPRRSVEKITPLKFEAPEEFIEEYDIPTTVLEALNQRLGIYRRYEREAERDGDETGVKRNSKIVQLYTEAIKLHRAGKKVPLEKLPTPPGCPPIPIPFELD